MDTVIKKIDESILDYLSTNSTKSLNKVLLMLAASRSSFIHVISALEPVLKDPQDQIGSERALELLYEIIEKIEDIQITEEEARALLSFVTVKSKQRGCAGASVKVIERVLDKICFIHGDEGMRKMGLEFFLDFLERDGWDTTQMERVIRHNIGRIFNTLITQTPPSIFTSPLYFPRLLTSLLTQLPGEKDPRNLHQSFHTFHRLLTLPSTSCPESFTLPLCTLLGAYFPITFPAMEASSALSSLSSSLKAIYTEILALRPFVCEAVRWAFDVIDRPGSKEEVSEAIRALALWANQEAPRNELVRLGKNKWLAAPDRTWEEGAAEVWKVVLVGLEGEGMVTSKISYSFRVEKGLGNARRLVQTLFQRNLSRPHFYTLPPIHWHNGTPLQTKKFSNP